MHREYQVPAEEFEAATEVKKSRFIARAAPVNDRAAAMAVLQRARAEHPDARHHCWAYLLGDPFGSCDASQNDDGEPAGTAGKPILNVIRHKGIGDIVVVVIRYFGGIKLGAGGLTRAYASAAEAVLSGLPLVRHEPLESLQLEFDFALEQAVRHWAAQHGAVVGDPEYSRQVRLVLHLPQRSVNALEAFCGAHGIRCMPDSGGN